MTIDLLVDVNEDTGLYDISLSDGDFTTIDSFDTSLKVSLLGDRRADKSEVSAAHLRRGWWANQFAETLGFQLGSKLWLLDQSRKSQNTLNSAIDYAKNSLQWLVDDGYAINITVTGVFTALGIQLKVVLFRGQSKTETKYFDLWENSGDVQ